MTDREKYIIKNIDRLSEDCIKYLESNYSVIPNIGLFNVDLIVFSFLIERLLKERGFRDKRMEKFLFFYEKHFISNRFNAPRKTTVYCLENDEIDSKNLVAYFKFEEMDYNEKRQYFIRTLSNVSTDINKFIESTKQFNESRKIHYPLLAIVTIYANPLFCYNTQLSDYSQGLRFIPHEIKNSNIDFNKFPVTFSKMWSEIFSKYLDDSSMFLDEIELNFPQDSIGRKQIEKIHSNSNNIKNNSGCMLLFSVIIILTIFLFSFK